MKETCLKLQRILEISNKTVYIMYSISEVSSIVGNPVIKVPGKKEN